MSVLAQGSAARNYNNIGVGDPSPCYIDDAGGRLRNAALRLATLNSALREMRGAVLGEYDPPTASGQSASTEAAAQAKWPALLSTLADIEDTLNGIERQFESIRKLG